jgi:hypothetical protein
VHSPSTQISRTNTEQLQNCDELFKTHFGTDPVLRIYARDPQKEKFSTIVPNMMACVFTSVVALVKNFQQLLP